MRPFDQNGAFCASPRGSLPNLAVKGAGATVFSGGLVLGIQVIATVILARLLTPSDFGLITMITTFSLLLINFGLNGFTEAVLQRKEINHFLISNLFWINAGAGLLLTVGFAAAGSLLARFYHDARVTRVAVGMSATIFLTTLSVQHLALLKRAMRFAVVSGNDILARAVSVGVSIMLALSGAGYWALVGGAVAQALSLCIGAWLFCRWLPGFPRRAEGTASMVRFAMSAYGRFIVNYCTWNLDNILVGWRFGPLSLGFYKKAYDLFALSTTQLTAPLTSVAVSALSRLNADSIKYRQYLLNALGVTAFVGMGLGADLTLIGKDLIRVLLGPGWEETGRIFTFFGPGIGIMLLYYTHGWIHLSIGRADRWLRWGVVEFSTTAMLFLLGLKWGSVGVAVAWTISFWILTLPALWYAARPIKLPLASMINTVWKYPVASAMAGFAASLVVRDLPSLLVTAPPAIAAMAHIALLSVLFGVLYLGAVVVLHWGYEPIDQLVGLLRNMVPWNRSAARAVVGSGMLIAASTETD